MKNKYRLIDSSELTKKQENLNAKLFYRHHETSSNAVAGADNIGRTK